MLLRLEDFDHVVERLITELERVPLETKVELPALGSFRVTSQVPDEPGAELRTDRIYRVCFMAASGFGVDGKPHRKGAQTSRTPPSPLPPGLAWPGVVGASSARPVDSGLDELDGLAAAIRSAILEGRDVEVRGLGRFEITQKPREPGTAPSTREPIRPRRIVQFTAEPDLAARVGRAHAGASGGNQRPKRRPPDQEAVLNESFTLYNAGKRSEALAVIERYLDAGGEPTARILTNYAGLVECATLTAEEIRKAQRRIANHFESNPALLLDAGLVTNALAFLNTRGRPADAIALAERALARGLVWNHTFACTLSYSAVILGDPGLAAKVADMVDTALAKNPGLAQTEPTVLDNVAVARAIAGDMDRAFASLAAFVELRKPDKNGWEEMERSHWYAAFRADPRWSRLKPGRSK